jgi:hypothetical protein
MASTISLLKDFDGGQGAGASNYFDYADDLDTNFTDIEQTVNTLVGEVSALQGPNARLAQDLLDSQSPAIYLMLIGDQSYAVTINGGDPTKLDVQTGVALVGVGRVENPSLVNLVGSGIAGTYYVAVQSNGLPSLESTVGQQEMDIYSVTWSGTQFTGTPTLIAEVGFDGDDYQDQLTAVGHASGGVPNQKHTRVANRLENIERLLRGDLTNIVSGATALGPIAFAGSVSTPGLIPTNATVYDTTTGFYRDGADVIGIAAQATQVARFLRPALNEGQVQFDTGNADANPAVAGIGDTNTGFNWGASDDIHVTGGGNKIGVFIWTAAKGQLRMSGSGTVGQPDYSFIGLTTAGMYSPGSDRLAFSTNSIKAIEIDAAQFVDSPTQPRCKATRSAALNLASSATPSNIAFDAEDYDVGAMHDPVTNNDRVTVPTDGDGLYKVTANGIFDESTSTSPNVGDRELVLTVNGNEEASTRIPSTGAGDTKLSVSDSFTLSAGDIVRAQVAQDSGGSMDVVDLSLAVEKLW